MKDAHTAPSEVVPHRVDLDLYYLTGPYEDLCSFERQEDIDENPTAEEESRGILFELVGGAVAPFFIGALVLGAMTIFEWLSRKFS